MCAPHFLEFEEASMSIIANTEYGILRLTISRAARRNTISSDMFDAMTDALEKAAQDDAVRVVLLKGGADVFSAGADIEESLKTPERINAAMSRFFNGLREFPKPIVAQVTGPAVGAAFALLLYCDLVYAGHHALFSMPAVALARTPRFGTARLMAAAAGCPRAAEKLLLSEPISAEEAVDMRLITAVLDDEHVENVVASKTARLAVLPPRAVAATKSVLRAGLNDFIKAGAAFEEAVAEKQQATPEAKEALTAFLEGRKPVYRTDDMPEND